MNSSERRKVLGAAGEALAGEYLVTQGWSILARNWRCREGEIDIVALDPARDCLVVVEVKTRAGTGFGAPLETITYAKVRRLRQLAALYARQHRFPATNLRVDAIGILWPRGSAPEVTHAIGIEQR